MNARTIGETNDFQCSSLKMKVFAGEKPKAKVTVFIYSGNFKYIFLGIMPTYIFIKTKTNRNQYIINVSDFIY